MVESLKVIFTSKYQLPVPGPPIARPYFSDITSKSVRSACTFSWLLIPEVSTMPTLKTLNVFPLSNE